MKKISILLVYTILSIFNMKIFCADEKIHSVLYIDQGLKTVSEMEKAIEIKLERLFDEKSNMIKLWSTHSLTVETKDEIKLPINFSNFTLMDEDIIKTVPDSISEIRCDSYMLILAENTHLKYIEKKDKSIFYLLQGSVMFKNIDGKDQKTVSLETKDIFTTEKIGDLVLSYLPQRGSAIFCINEKVKVYEKSNLIKFFNLQANQGLNAKNKEVVLKNLAIKQKLQIKEIFKENEELEYQIVTPYLNQLGQFLVEAKFKATKEAIKNEEAITKILISKLGDRLDASETTEVVNTYMKNLNLKSATNAEQSSPYSENLNSINENNIIVEKNIPDKEANVNSKKEIDEKYLQMQKDRLKQIEELRQTEERLKREALEAELKAKALE